MEVRVPRAIVAEIRAHALATYPEECCGFLIGRDEGEVRIVTEARRARNAEPAMREARYTIDPRDTLALDRELRATRDRLLGFYHSHPEGPPVPSPHDAARAWPWYTYGILAVRRDGPGEFLAWSFDEAAGAFRNVEVHIVDDTAPDSP